MGVFTAFKKDEVHVKQFSWKLRIVVSVLCIMAVLLLVYLASYSFANLNPFITILLIFILLLVCGIVVFAVDIAFSREWQ